MRFVKRCAVVLIAVLSGALSFGQRNPSSEERAEAAMNRVRNDSGALRTLLRDMPKGGDLHSHLSGAVYAETFLREAAEDNLCVDPASGSVVRPPPTGSSDD